jgi:hypothetical protein
MHHADCLAGRVSFIMNDPFMRTRPDKFFLTLRNRHHESMQHEDFIFHEPTTLGGLSIGLLSAAAISSSRTLEDLCRAGIESARIAFWLGVHVDRVSQLLEAQNDDDPDETWAYVISGLSQDEVSAELAQYNASSVSPAPDQQLFGTPP